LGWEQAYGNPNTILQQDQNWAQSLGNAPIDTPSNQLTGGWQNPDAWAVLLDVNGNLAEGQGSNIFLVRNGGLKTPRERYVLPGVSRQATIDLGAPHEIFAILFWHFHKTPRVYLDVVVQLADDEPFKTNVRTVFNDDHDNTSGLGAGKDMNYVETAEGKLVDAKGSRARYVRLYSKGSNANELNHYVEVEVFGRPAK
jgi:hypothetical protein